MKVRPIVVTLTSIPPRFANLPRKIASLMRQTVPPDSIELYLPRSYRRFPGPRPRLPRLPAPVRIIDVDDDLGPATKVLPASHHWHGENIDLLFCDDDRPEDPGWVARFASARRHRPDDIVCESGWLVDTLISGPRHATDQPRVQVSPQLGKTLGYHVQRLLTLRLYTPKTRVYSQSGYADVFAGVYGAMMAPGVFQHPEAWNIPDILWTVDDVWLSGMARKNGTRIWVNSVARPVPRDRYFDRIAALKHHVERRFDREGANRLCVQYFRDRCGIWR